MARRRGRRLSYGASAGYGAASAIVSAVIGLVSSIAVARAFGIDVVGEYALVSAPMGAMLFLSTLREQAALAREVAVLEPRDPRATSLFAAVMTLSFGITSAVAVIVMVAAYFAYAGPVGHPELFGPALFSMAGYVLFENSSFNIDAVLAAFRAGSELFTVRMIQALGYLSMAVVGGVLWGNVWALTAAMVLSYVLGFALRLHLAQRFLTPSIDREGLRWGFGKLPEMIRFSLKLVPGSVADGVGGQAATWILGSTQSVAAVGAYNRAFTVSSRFQEVSWRINEVLFPTLVERRSTGDAAGFDRALVDSMRYFGMALLLPAAVGGGAAVGVMQVFGPGFTAGATALSVLLLLPVFAGLSGMLGYALNAADRPLHGSYLSVARMVVTVGLTLVLTSRFGVTGAAVGLVLGYAAGTVVIAAMMRREMTTSVVRLWGIRPLLALVVAAIAGFAVSRAVDSATPGILGLVLALAAGSATYAGCLISLGGLTARDRERLSEFRARRASRPKGLVTE